MKTFLIVLLSAALLAAALFTRPDEQNFRDHLARTRTPGDATNFRKAMAEMEAEAFAETCDFKDRLLWVDVQRDGRTIYTGAFAHWFKFAGDGSPPAVSKSVATKSTGTRSPSSPEAKPASAKVPAARKPVKRPAAGRSAERAEWVR